jgi:hypothetical protein
MDVFERAVAGDLADSLVSDMMSYAFRVVMSLVQSRDYRSQLLRTLVRLYRALSTLGLCADVPVTVIPRRAIFCG